MAARRACDICYRRKIQCSIPSPGKPCDWCSHHDKECTFNREAPRRSQRMRLTRGRVQELLQRIQQLEDARDHSVEETASPVSTQTDGTVVCDEGVDGAAVSAGAGSTATQSIDGIDGIVGGTGTASRSCCIDLLDRLTRRRSRLGSSTDHPASLSTASQESSSLAGQPARIHYLRHCMGPNWFFNGMPIFSEQGRRWLASRTGQPVDWARFRLLTAGDQDPLPVPEDDDLLIVKEVVQQTYSTSPFRMFYPIVDPVLIRDTIDTTFERPKSPLSSHFAARAYLLAALAVVGGLEGYEPLEVGVGIDAEWCADRSRELLQRNIGDASLETLQATLLLHLHKMANGHWHEATLLLSTACGIVSALGGHLYSPPRPSGEISTEDRREQHTRQLFWLCYMFDKDLSLRTGHIPLLTEDYCDLTLPENCYLNRLDDLDDERPVLPGDPRLSILKERVYRMLFSARALRCTDGLLVHIRQLDVDLERWRQSVPAAVRPMLAIPTTKPLLPTDISDAQRMHRIYLQLEYHQIITIIHTTVRRYSSSDDTDAERAQNFHTVIHSSVDLSLEASRSTLWCLRELIAQLGRRAFRFIVFYPTTAALSLFLNIVIHPYDEEAQFDVERLVAAANVIRGMPTQGPMEAERVRDTSNFILSLVSLGTSAIVEATGR